MYAPFSKGQMQLLTPTSVSYRDSFQDASNTAGLEGTIAAPRRSNLLAALARVWQSIVEMPRRRAVLAELSLLSDRELVDIGLNRNDLGRVFQPAFVASRNGRSSFPAGFQDI
jgi:uncharacterized protein YjiS (DUF1127 family)